jgi:(S)-mandelate dehydrogenase
VSRLARCAHASDFEAWARRRLPRVIQDYVAGGAESERALARNQQAFSDATLLPRVLAGSTARDSGVTVFGQRYAGPLGIAPTGLANLVRHGADLQLTRAARAMRVPFVMSGAASTTIEEVGAAAGPNWWYQVYMPRDRAIGRDLVQRAQDSGARVLVLTVDVPVPGRRARDLRNGFSLPLRPSLRLAWDVATHAAWAIDMARHGAPRLANLQKYSGERATAQSLAALQAEQIDGSLNWADLDTVRAWWPHSLVVKGVLHADDARRCIDAGADGIWVSNHGGRQFDAAPATLHALPAVRAAVGQTIPVLMDGGVRTGADLALAVAAGADFCFAGRPALMAVAAAGQAGVEQWLTGQIDAWSRALALCGCSQAAGLRQSGF